MTFTPYHYLKVLQQQTAIINRAEERVRLAYERARECPLPDLNTLRPAVSDDIFPGQILWQLDAESEEHCWSLVEEVYHSEGYVCWSSQGCNYGLTGFFVKK